MRQRSDLTFKENLKNGRHGWLRLTPAYSAKLVQNYLPDNNKDISILDPFSGSGTTPLFAGYEGYKCLALELNPFLVWFAEAKTRNYSFEIIKEAEAIGNEIISLFISDKLESVQPPPIKNIERWWDESALNFLCSIKWGIEENKNEIEEQSINLLNFVFSITMMKLSNTAHNHQSLSFSESENQSDLFDLKQKYVQRFKSDLNFVIESANDNPEIEATIIKGDAREVDSYISNKVDLVITSPPYPNRMSYIRELRPYMYWNNFLFEAREAGELDWEAIGGTWGIATSRLTDWTPDKKNGFYPDYFTEILKKISDQKNKNGNKMANYVARYFEDTYQHLLSITKLLNPNSKVHYVIGNSTFYGVLVPVEILYKDIMLNVGFRNVNIEKIRKRNSKKELFEFVVSADYG